MTQLEAINEILLSINEMPLTNEEFEAGGLDTIQTCILARTYLDISRKEILSNNYIFNSFTMSLVPNISGYIIIPEGYLYVNADDDNIIIRDNKLYDKTEESFIFEEPVSITVYEDYDIEDIPQQVSNYIVKKASLMAYSAMIGDANGINIKSNLLAIAKVDANKYKIKQSNTNVLENTHVTTFLDRSSL